MSMRSPKDSAPPSAWIDEARCIGCTLCIQACPFDAIVGTARRMHTVVEPMCTGCRLCVPPCPVDCIVIQAASPSRTWTDAERRAAGARVKARKRRLERERLEHDERLAARSADQEGAAELTVGPTALERIGSLVARAVRRARQRRAAQP